MEFINSLFQIPVVFKLHTIHPFLVHFPIGLLLTAFLFFIFARITSSKTAELIAVANLITGALLSFAAAYSGVIADERLNFTPQVHQLMEIHEKLGWVVAGYFTVLSIWAFFAYKRPGSKNSIIPHFILDWSCFARIASVSGWLHGI
jgi:uncharacterized membrane protein